MRPDSWNRKLQELKEYKQEHGHCMVNTGTRTPLANWVKDQRRMRKLLTESQRASLDELGFVWEEIQKKRNDIKWDDKFDQLKHYKRVYGHTQVPREWPENPQLGKWVSYQRSLYGRGLLPDDREAKLKSLGFVWKVCDNNSSNYTKLDEMWLEKYEKLKEFKAIQNHTNVPLQVSGRSCSWSLGEYTTNVLPRQPVERKSPKISGGDRFRMGPQGTDSQTAMDGSLPGSCCISKSTWALRGAQSSMAPFIVG